MILTFLFARANASVCLEVVPCSLSLFGSIRVAATQLPACPRTQNANRLDVVAAMGIVGDVTPSDLRMGAANQLS